MCLGDKNGVSLYGAPILILIKLNIVELFSYIPARLKEIQLRDALKHVDSTYLNLLSIPNYFEHAKTLSVHTSKNMKRTF